MDYDWLYRQSFLYDLGGLRGFLANRASGDLVAGSDRIGEWARATMGGFRLVAKAHRTLTWEDLATRRQVDVLNIGAAAFVDLGECAIGRVVPIRDGAMFETAPLPVPDPVAAQVAAEPADWIATLTAACREYGVGPRRDSRVGAIQISGAHDFALLTDVLQDGWRLAQQTALAGLTQRPGYDGPDQVFFDALRLCAAGPELVRHRDNPAFVDAWPDLAAALVEPGVLDALCRHARPDWHDAWFDLAELLPEPAAGICFEVAQEARNVA